VAVGYVGSAAIATRRPTAQPCHRYRQARSENHGSLSPSTPTNRVGSRPSWILNRARRRIGTSGLSCSDACAVFQPRRRSRALRDEQPEGKSRSAARRTSIPFSGISLAILDHRLDELVAGVATRAASSARRERRLVPKPGTCRRSHRRCCADPKPSRSSPSRRPLGLDQNALTRIVGAGPSLLSPLWKPERESPAFDWLNTGRTCFIQTKIVACLDVVMRHLGLIAELAQVLPFSIFALIVGRKKASPRMRWITVPITCLWFAVPGHADDPRLAHRRMIDIDPRRTLAFHASDQTASRVLSTPDPDMADRFRHDVIKVPRANGVWSVLAPARLPDTATFSDAMRVIGDRQ